MTTESRWSLRKEISLVDLIAIVSAVIAVIYSWSVMDKRVTIIEEARAAQKTTDDRQDEANVRYQQRIDGMLVEINRKLDRLIERR